MQVFFIKKIRKSTFTQAELVSGQYALLLVTTYVGENGLRNTTHNEFLVSGRGWLE